MKSNILPIILGFVIFFLGVVCGFYTSFILDVTASDKPTQVNSLRESGYKYINPLLDYDTNLGATDYETKEAKKQVETLISDLHNSGSVSHMSVYYRDLNNGPWFGINEDEEFTPASLLKVPIMLAVFRYAEDNPDFLNKEIVFTEDMFERHDNSHDLPKEYLPREQLVVGNTYTIQDIMVRMIADSDNTAFKVMLEYISQDEIKKVHTDLGLLYPTSDTPEDFISVKSYSSVFRVLYNSSYLSRRYSEEALSMLDNARFNLGIVNGVPENVRVSNKFGVRSTENYLQLHDCGIVYNPESPYILCVMTRGNDLDSLSSAISLVSEKVYTVVSGSAN